jgi:two-component system chemotaxis response regulator CheB
LLDDPTNGYRNRTIDALFRSVAAHAGSEMIGVVLSGSLDDGSRGLAAIKAAGGTSMVLTPNRRGRKGMPENAINYDGPLNLRRLAKPLCTLKRTTAAAPISTAVTQTSPSPCAK